MGYLIIDHSASPPGIQRQMEEIHRAATGMRTGGRRFELDTVACRHCGNAIAKIRYKVQGGFCFGCNGAICEPPCTSGCISFKQVMDQKLNQKVHERQLIRLGLSHLEG